MRWAGQRAPAPNRIGDEGAGFGGSVAAGDVNGDGYSDGMRKKV
jgi:hypothetical protein